MSTCVRHLRIAIERHADDVYAFMADPENLPRWASGLGDDFHRDGDAWVAVGVLGTVRVRFSPINPFRVLDHDVTLPDGVVVHNPLRVLAHDDRAIVVFTLLRQPGVDDAAFEKDAAHVEADPHRLRGLLER